MKKTLRIVGLGLAAVLLSVGMTACLGGDDDEDGEDLWEGSVEAPAYESDASCYTILDSDELESIELTASGNYIIVPTANGSYQELQSRGQKWPANVLQTIAEPGFRRHGHNLRRVFEARRRKL